MVSLIQRLVGRLRKIQAPINPKEWKNFEYFDTAWKERIRIMAGYIPENTGSVIDIGCGKMWLKEYIPFNCIYHGVDYVYRGAGSQVHDLNKYEFPVNNYDMAFVSGCLEYINDYGWLIKKIAAHSAHCVISYCTIDLFKNAGERISLGWVNHLTESDLIELFNANNMQLKSKDKTSTSNSIYVFSK